MFFGTKLIKYQVSFGDPLNLWGFYSLTAPHYGKGSNTSIVYSQQLVIMPFGVNQVNTPNH